MKKHKLFLLIVLGLIFIPDQMRDFAMSGINAFSTAMVECFAEPAIEAVTVAFPK